MAQEATTKTVTFDGDEYTVAVQPMEDLDVLEAWEDSKYATLARTVLGAKQWATFKQKKRTTAETLQLVVALLGLEDADEEE